MGWGFHGEVNFSGFPIVADFGEQGGDEAEEGGFLGKEAGDAGATFEFLIHALQRIGRAEFFLVGQRQGERGEALGEIFFQPRGEFRRTGGVAGDKDFELRGGTGTIGGVEEVTDRLADFRALL